MKISNHLELIQFMKRYFDNMTTEDYVKIVSMSIGIYEYQKPNGLEQLIDKIEAYMKLNPNFEKPLFW